MDFHKWWDVNKVKYPYIIHKKSTDIFSLGYIYESWKDKNSGVIKNKFSILTTRANPMMERIHNLKKRMLHIISRKDEKKWIEPNLTPNHIQELIKPYNEADIVAYTVSINVSG